MYQVQKGFNKIFLGTVVGFIFLTKIRCGVVTYSESVSSILTNDDSKSSAVNVDNSYNGKTQ